MTQRPPAMDYPQRQRRLAEALRERRLEALLVTHMPNVRYLCGFTGSAGALAVVAGKETPRLVLFTDGRYTEQAQAEAQRARVVTWKGPPAAGALPWLVRQGVSPIAMEAEHLSAASWRALARLAKGRRLRQTSGLVEGLRMVKEQAEVELVRRAVRLGSDLLSVALRAIRPGVPEAEVAAKLEYAARKAGAQGMSFETIVAAGPRSALPHGVASDRPIPRNGFVILDFGVILGGYCSDMTRTVHVGRVPARSRQIYNAVLEAQLAAISAVRAGVSAGEVDAAARKLLQRARLGRYFSHSTGHGLGLEIHEGPRLAARQTQRLEAGMLVTIEPGVYIAGQGGVRIEDVVLVTESGCEVLTEAPKALVTL